jgi:protein ImuB
VSRRWALPVETILFFDARRAMSLYAVIHLADFALQALLRNDPAFATAPERPVALLDAERRDAIIIALTSSARAAGVELGQSAPQALARCAKLILRTPQPTAEEEARAALLAAAFSVSPMVEATAPGLCTLNLAGRPRDCREPALRGALDQLQRFGLIATAGLATTPLLAFYAAAQASAAEPLCVVDNGRALLEALPISAGEPSREMASILAGWGVHTLGDLTRLPKADVTQRLGPEGLALWERAAGETHRPLQLYTPPPVFTASMEFENEIETLEPLLFILRRFLDRLALELRNASKAAAEIKIALDLADDTRYERSFRLPEPTTREEILFRTLHTHLETLHTPAAIKALRLELEPTRPLERQHGLFDSALRDAHGFAETLARAVAIVGSGGVGTPVAENSHRPDAIRLTAPPPIVPASSAGEPLHPPQGPALRRFRPPLPAKVELSRNGHSPAYLWADDIQGEVKGYLGPWSSSGDWWEIGRAWHHEIWEVELESGGLYRLLNSADGSWYLEGEYD